MAPALTEVRSRNAMNLKLSVALVRRIDCLILHSFFIRIYFRRISRLKFAKFLEYFKNKAEAEILKRIDIILCVETSVNTIQFMFLT